MLKEILSPESCAACRLCCTFDESDLWEIPVFSAALGERVARERPELPLLPYGVKSRVLKTPLGADGLARCPALSERGCTLGENKPFDCMIWPFRVMEREGRRLLTISSLCAPSQKIDREKLAAFAEKLLPTVRKEIEENPDVIKPYRGDYRIVAAL
ncbi:MAG: hypothetical protein NC084_11485 [Bacteroides sp.]|nr:hypothetical protein [Eubacterium sp.]MCM1419719.1 hypothetical protein [Roseburia sp.]MCM1463313.1 hypothetical protein [Bacteroides sp.]